MCPLLPSPCFSWRVWFVLHCLFVVSNCTFLSPVFLVEFTFLLSIFSFSLFQLKKVFQSFLRIRFIIPDTWKVSCGVMLLGGFIYLSLYRKKRSFIISRRRRLLWRYVGCLTYLTSNLAASVPLLPFHGFLGGFSSTCIVSSWFLSGVSFPWFFWRLCLFYPFVRGFYLYFRPDFYFLPPRFFRVTYCLTV